MALKNCVLDDSTGKIEFVLSNTVVVTQDPTITAVNAPAGTLVIWADSTTSKFYYKRDNGATTNVAPADESALSSKANGDWGWAVRGSPSFSILGGTTARLTLGSDSIIKVGGRQVYIPYGNYDVVPSGSAGQRYAYFDDASKTLKLSASPWSLFSTVPVFTCHWNGSAVDAIGYEMHGMRDLVWHYYQHKYVGMQYDSGIVATGAVQTDNNTNPPATAEYLWFTTGQVTDEDNAITVGTSYWNQTLGTALTSADAAIITFWYWNGITVVKQNAMADRTPFIHAGGNTTPMWNNAGTMQAAATGTISYVVYFYYASVLVGGDCLFARPMTAVYTTLAAATLADPSALTWSGFPADDAKYVYRAIFKVDTTRYTTPTHRSKLVQLDSYRLTPGTPIASVNATSHNILSLRDAADCHPISSITGLDAALNNIYTESAAQVTADLGVTEVALTALGLTLTSTCLLGVIRNGQDLFEGASLDFTRDVGNNKILFNYTVPKNAKLKFRVYRG